MRRPGASCGGGLSCAATCSRDRWLFTTELGLQAWSHQNKKGDCGGEILPRHSPLFICAKNGMGRFSFQHTKTPPTQTRQEELRRILSVKI